MAQAAPNATDASAPGLVLDGLRVQFGAQFILDDFSTRIEGGSLTAVLGASGVGKSTLLRRIAGLVDGAGQVAADDSFPLTDRTAFMGQSDLLLPWLNVAKNASLGARLRGESASLARLERVLSEVGLTEARDQRPAALSGGMRQRAALARTLMEDRAIVLMDEPFSAVDALTRLRLQDLATRLLAGRTVVLVTHDPWEAIRMADRIIVLAGRPAQIALDVLPDGTAPRSPDTPAAQALWRRMLQALSAEGVEIC